MKANLVMLKLHKIGKNKMISGTFKEFALEIYLPYVHARKRSAGTDLSLIRNHLLPFFKLTLLEDVCALDIIKFQTLKLDEKYKKSSINRMTVLLKFMMNCARRWRLVNLDRDWSNEAPEFRNDPNRERFLSEDEACRLIRVCIEYENQIAGLLVLLLLFSGARKSELLNAKWSDYDPNSSTINVPLSKSGFSRRIYLSAEAKQIVAAAEKNRSSNQDFMFPHLGQNRPIRSFGRDWIAIRQAAKLLDFRLHDLRHSFASFAIKGGASIYEVQKLLGHADTKTTMRYAHLADKHLTQVASILPHLTVSMLDE